MNNQNSLDEANEFASGTRENLQIENEILRMKVIAEHGGIENSLGDLPPEIENEFLKNVLAFETNEIISKDIKLFHFLGNPVFKNADELTAEELHKETDHLIYLLKTKNISIDFLRERDDRTKYKFITEELMNEETCDRSVPGIVTHFIYEEFHPDHEMEISERTEQFIAAWFEKNTQQMKYGVIESFIQPDGIVLSGDEIINKIQLALDSYSSFQNCEFTISDMKFQLQDGDVLQGLGHSEGMIKYAAIVENGEHQTIEGTFKLYMTRESDWWSIFYFVMPGFNG